MKLLYFAWVRQRTGVSEETVDVPDSIATIADLIDWLKTRNESYEAAFDNLKLIRAAINREHVALDAPIKDAREIAFFPPVTGG